MWALYICIFIVIYGRMIEIYLVTSVAPVPMAAMTVSYTHLDVYKRQTLGLPMRTGSHRAGQGSPSPGRNPRENSSGKQRHIASVSLPIIYTSYGYGTVSYTHLDVYKRQANPVFLSACAMKWNQLQNENTPLRAMLNGKLQSVSAVSYTHLDVYKRQMYAILPLQTEWTA